MFDNPFSMVVAIVFIVTIGGILRARYSAGKDWKGNNVALHDPDTQRLRDEVKALKERVAVLERLATDNTSALDREIEKLRERDRA
ncbi:hypothetical protein [Sphingomonas cavernae]|uniref:Phage shock protein B n=1 Tax=Sphingomonas cavernae TaxID=2320861 RepID=A0A418WLY8_9SPHN|nr:hypothetical protein [Sphingomonas cavernae]RJF91016.1 hypothetical protein D3876_12765 [Sphingomonas cavernae]